MLCSYFDLKECGRNNRAEASLVSVFAFGKCSLFLLEQVALAFRDRG
jgi:hypothetical protein